MTEKSEPAIIVKNIKKTFRIPLDKTSGIKQVITSFYKRKKGYRELVALDDVSFEIEKGEFFGIVGRNGSGKSTLLKTLAGVYSPDSGDVAVNGSLTPFIELGVGFNPELSGRENVFLNGALLGFSHSEMEDMYEEIVDFAELHDFMEERLKNYSSGMQVRLAFSIAIRAKSDILLLDEVLAVGDSKFQNKCYAEFRKMKKEDRTIILVTHDMSAVERFCDRAIVLKNGKSTGICTPNEAAVMYERMNADVEKQEKNITDKETDKSKRWGTGEVKLKDISIFDKKEGSNPTVLVNQGSDIDIHLEFENKIKSDSRNITVGLAFHDAFDVNIAGPNSSKYKINSSRGVVFTIPKLSFVPGEYVMTVAIFDENSEKEFDHIEEAVKITVVSDQLPQYGKLNLFGKWNQNEKKK